MYFLRGNLLPTNIHQIYIIYNIYKQLYKTIMSQREALKEKSDSTFQPDEFLPEEQSVKLAEFNMKIPTSCPQCGSVIFYLWGTLVNGRLYTEVVCKKCGTMAHQARNFA